jgi:soluble lytic murein transglycosylase
MKYNVSILAAAFSLLFTASIFAQPSDAALRNVAEKDKTSRDSAGKLLTLTAADHLSRGQIYFENRQFPQSREHFEKILTNFPEDSAVANAVFLTGRSYYWEREYARAITFLDRVAADFPATKDGREGLYFSAACHVRLGKHAEAAKLYERYVSQYANGERVEGAHLNLIDALREAGKFDDAKAWVEKTRAKFAGQPAEANALQGQLRMELARGRWAEAVAVADVMLAGVKFSGSMTSLDEIKYLKGLALEKSGKRTEAAVVFAAIPESSSSYYSGLASDRQRAAGGVRSIAQVNGKDFPIVFRDEILTATRPRKIDPRFVLAIMKQESSFRAAVKSPSAARGLLQLVIDTAMKYNKQAGYPNLQPDDLYNPQTNIAIGTEYILDLSKEFNGMYEAIAASYNGGEDNAARWLARAKSKDPGIFAAEVGFAETKNYVFKVMNNYRAYRELYDENLVRR